MNFSPFRSPIHESKIMLSPTKIINITSPIKKTYICPINDNFNKKNYEFKNNTYLSEKNKQYKEKFMNKNNFQKNTEKIDINLINQKENILFEKLEYLNNENKSLLNLLEKSKKKYE